MFSFIRSRSRLLVEKSRSRPKKGLLRNPAGSTLNKTDEILNDILIVSSHIDKRLFKKKILINK